MTTVFDLLSRIHNNPGLYLGYPSVSNLFMLLHGYEIARSELGVALTAEETRFFEEFQPWLQRKLGVKSVTSWAKLIMLSCHDEKTGFSLFFELLEQFQQEEAPLGQVGA